MIVDAESDRARGRCSFGARSFGEAAFREQPLLPCAFVVRRAEIVSTCWMMLKVRGEPDGLFVVDIVQVQSGGT